MAGDIGEQAEDGLPSHCQELPGVGPFSKQELNTSTGKYRKCHGTLRMVFPATARNSAELDHSANRNWTQAQRTEHKHKEYSKCHGKLKMPFLRHCQELPSVGPFSKQELSTTTGNWTQAQGTEHKHREYRKFHGLNTSTENTGNVMRLRMVFPRHCQEFPGVGPFSKQELNTSTGNTGNVMTHWGWSFPTTARNSPELDNSANRNWTQAQGIQEMSGHIEDGLSPPLPGTPRSWTIQQTGTEHKHLELNTRTGNWTHAQGTEKARETEHKHKEYRKCHGTLRMVFPRHYQELWLFSKQEPNTAGLSRYMLKMVLPATARNSWPFSKQEPNTAGIISFQPNYDLLV